MKSTPLYPSHYEELKTETRFFKIKAYNIVTMSHEVNPSNINKLYNCNPIIIYGNQCREKERKTNFFNKIPEDRVHMYSSPSIENF
jgi:hypothetical protein